MTRKQRRLAWIGSAGAVLALAVGLILYSLSDQIVFFNSPTDVAEGKVGEGTRFRLGGLVADNSVIRGQGETVSFEVTDTNATLKVTYTGILPDLFREGQGVVTEGAINAEGVFVADTVLAKHDEQYMPPEVAEALKRQGVWQHGGEAEAGEAVKPVPSGSYAPSNESGGY